jgi:hypothetical protein
LKGPIFKYSKEENSPSYLIVCDGGNVRSASLATTLKLDYGREAIAVGRLYMSPHTMEILTDWADRIVVTQPHMIESIPEHNHNKVSVIDFGIDQWGINIPPTLNEAANNGAQFLVDSE